MRRAAKVDLNQQPMVNELRACGLHVMLTHQLGKGAPDCIVTGHNAATGRTEALLVEIKTAKGKMTADEVAWHADYPPDGPLLVARSAEDVLRWFGRA